MTMMTRTIALFVLLAQTASALDLSISGYSCESLPVSLTGTLAMDCDGSSQCSFGSEVDLTGTVTYSGLENANIYNNVAYASLTLSVAENAADKLEFNGLVNQEYSLCTNSLVAQDDYECPADGDYDYEVSYTLPALTDNQFANWFASGWTGQAVISVTNVIDGTVIGLCTVDFVTRVTANGSSSGMAQAVSGRSGLAMFVGALALGVLGCCYCAFCRRSGGKQVDTKAHETEFTRMEDKSAAPTKPSASSPRGGPAWAAV